MTRAWWTLLVGLLPLSAWADAAPTVWDKIRDREAYERYELHRRVRDKISSADDDTGLLGTRTFGYESARIDLEDANVESTNDPALLFDYGEVLEALDEHEKAIAVLTRALDLAPHHQAAAEANLILAFAYAKTDRSEEELERYHEYLRSSRRWHGLATATLNMAEAEMRMGRLDQAVRGYRESFRLATAGRAGGQETAALACYGLAVALDRQGDVAGSRAEMARALGIDPSMYQVLNSPYVFFVPAYERYFYIGLGFEARARDTSQPLAARHTHLRRAVNAFQSYVSGAREGDRWAFRAKEHLTELQAWGKSLPPAKAARATDLE